MLLRAGFFLVLLCSSAPSLAQEFSLAPVAARELREMCGDDRGRLWGVSLCGPLLLADPATRQVWASEQDAEGRLTRSGEGWAGALPPGVPIANTSVDWAGVRWTMVVAPLPANDEERRALLAHEAWHRVQSQLGLTAQGSDASHLESERGRTLMRLEMRALATALRSRGNARRSAAQDALLLRGARLQEMAGAFAQEAALDRNEGLAAYTGVRLGVTDQPDFFAARALDQYESHQALARSYAYATGPAYGLLLDDYRRNWRSELGAYAPADLLNGVLAAAVGDRQRLARAEERYGAAAVAGEERARAQAQMARLAELRRRFGEARRLELPLQQMQFEFDPNQVTPVDGLGSFYGRLTLRDAWGELTADEGALIDATFTRLVAATPGADGLSGPGWRLRLNPGWQVLPADASEVLWVIPAPELEAPAPDRRR